MSINTRCQQHYTMYDWSVPISSATYGCSVWRAISNIQPLIQKFSKISIGNGNNTSFWMDAWIGQSALKVYYPNIFKISGLKSGTIKDFIKLDADSHQLAWDLHLKREPRNSEMNELLHLIDFIKNPMHLQSDKRDSRLWSPSKYGKFSSKSFYIVLSNSEDSAEFPHHAIWITQLPTKFNFLMWLIFFNKISTIDNLRKRGFFLTNICSLCMKNEENANHIFMQCPFTWKIWSRLIPKKKWNWITPNGIAQLLHYWSNLHLGKSVDIRMILRLVPTAICWCIWSERNDRTFRNIAHSEEDILFEIKCTLARWISVLFTDIHVDFQQWLFFWESVIDPH